MATPKKKKAAKKVLIYFEDYHHDGLDKVVEATEEEWEALIAPAIKNRHPIDSATIDSDLQEKLYERKGKDLKLSEIKKIDRVIPMV